MELKILHAADLHLNSPFGSFPEEQKQYLRKCQQSIPERLLELSHRQGCRLWLLAGDIFDGNCSTATWESLCRVFRLCGVPVLIAPGNHDPFTSDSPWMTRAWPDNVHIFSEHWEALDFPDLDCTVYGAGFTSMDSPALLPKLQVQSTLRYQIAVVHGDPIHVASPNNPVTTADVRHSGLHYLAMGHIHKGGSFTSGNTICAWPGCAMGRGWDETGDKGVYIVTLDSDVQLSQVSLNLPQFYSMDWDAGKPVYELENRLPSGFTQDFFRVTLQGNQKVDLQSLRQRFDFLPNLTLIDKVQESSFDWESYDSTSFRGVFYEILQQADDPELAALAAEISAKLLEGREVELP